MSDDIDVANRLREIADELETEDSEPEPYVRLTDTGGLSKDVPAEEFQIDEFDADDTEMPFKSNGFWWSGVEAIPAEDANTNE